MTTILTDWVALKKLDSYFASPVRYQFRQLSALLLSLSKKWRKGTQDGQSNSNRECNVELAMVHTGIIDCVRSCFYCLWFYIKRPSAGQSDSKMPCSRFRVWNGGEGIVSYIWGGQGEKGSFKELLSSPPKKEIIFTSFIHQTSIKICWHRGNDIG